VNSCVLEAVAEPGYESVHSTHARFGTGKVCTVREEKSVEACGEVVGLVVCTSVGSGMKAEPCLSRPTRRSESIEGYIEVEAVMVVAKICSLFGREEALNGGVCCPFEPETGGALPFALPLRRVLLGGAGASSLCVCG